MQRSLVRRFCNSFMPRLSLVAMLSVSLFFGGSLHGRAQQMNTDTQSWSDANLPKPTSSGHPAGYADPAAMQELQMYEKVTGGTNWTGMKATGTMTETGATGPESARLFMLPGNRTRLEVDTPTGEDRTVIKGNHGFIHYAHDDRGYHNTDQGAHSGPRDVPLSPRTAAAGLIPFDLPFAVLASPAAYTVTDQGSISVDGSPAHRITIELTLTTPGLLPGESKQMVVDCYFDPQTHLLRKTATEITLLAFGQQRLLRVTSYGSYQTSGQMTVPFSYAETIDGRSLWTLQLTTADTATHPNPEIF